MREFRSIRRPTVNTSTHNPFPYNYGKRRKIDTKVRQKVVPASVLGFHLRHRRGPGPAEGDRVAVEDLAIATAFRHAQGIVSAGHRCRVERRDQLRPALAAAPPSQKG